MNNKAHSEISEWALIFVEVAVCLLLHNFVYDGLITIFNISVTVTNIVYVHT